MRYVIYCPNRECGFANPENRNPPLCEKCNTFIGDVGAVPYQEAVSANMPVSAIPVITAAAPFARNIGSCAEVTRRGDGPQIRLLLVASGRVFVIEAGQTVGMEHPSGTANVKISGVPGCDYIHRQHCTFEYSGGQWFIRPIDQILHGGKFNNQTLVNGVIVAPGAYHPVRTGDRIHLHAVELTLQSAT